MKGYPTLYKDIIFIEAGLDGFHKLKDIAVDLSFKFGAQLKNLNDVRDDLVTQATALGCNCITQFKYGQKSRWLAIDDVAFFGSGIAGNISNEKYNEIVSYINERDGR